MPCWQHAGRVAGAHWQVLDWHARLADANAGKPTEWPELVGQDAEHAKEVIAAFGYNVFLVPEVRSCQICPSNPTVAPADPVCDSSLTSTVSHAGFMLLLS